MNYSNPPAQSIDGFFHRTFHSNIYGREIGYNIYLPPDYHHSGERYPVFYHNHGWTGNESTEIVPMESLCRSRNAITVFVNHAHVTSNVWELPNAPMDIEELIPHIDRVCSHEYCVNQHREADKSAEDHVELVAARENLPNAFQLQKIAFYFVSLFVSFLVIIRANSVNRIWNERTGCQKSGSLFRRG